MSIPSGLSHPPQRSFKPRRRGLSAARTLAYERAIARWGIAVDGDELSFDDLFVGMGTEASDVVLDIGFGGGEALIELAETRPHEAVIGVDVHTPGVAAVLEAVESRGLRNVRVVDGDVIEFMPRVPSRSLAGSVSRVLPRPVAEARQRTRRLIRPDIVASTGEGLASRRRDRIWLPMTPTMRSRCNWLVTRSRVSRAA